MTHLPKHLKGSGVSRIEFLEMYRPGGHWLLTAISTDRKFIETKTFDSTTTDEAEAWIKKHNEQERNIYFNVNPTFHPMSQKAKRIDIESLAWLHVDCDIEKDETYEDGLARIKKLVTVDCPTVPPTLVIFSGGGYQAFWKISNPLELDGTIPVAMDAARYNKQLEIMFKGDNCHNIDRIMRLPFTTNWPNDQKKARGRVPVDATILKFTPDKLIYDLEEFRQAPALQAPGIEPNQVEIDIHSIEKLVDVNDLDKWNVDDRIKLVIVQGWDEEQPKIKKNDVGDFNSRSIWLFDVCCQLVRADVPDEVIFAVITDNRFKISASVLDKGSNTNKYATRQISRAHEYTEEPALMRLNDRHIVIGNIGGKCRVLEEYYDYSMKRKKLTAQTFENFKNRYSNKYVETQIGDKIKVQTLGNWWLSHKQRRQAENIVFTSKAPPEGSYNLWCGYSVEAKPGDGHHEFLEHLLINICQGNNVHLNYLLGWMARTVQFPDKLGETAIVMRGESGTGKSFVAQHLGFLLGRHFVQVSDARHLTGNFNAHLRDCVLLFSDEAFYANDKRHESVLKTMITTKEKNIEQKGLDIDSAPNFIHLMMASNESWVIPSGRDERRFFVLDIGNEHKQDNDYFEKIQIGLEEGGYENLLHYLLNYDLKNFNVYKVPETAALMDQKLHSLDPMHEWWLGRLQDGALLSSQTAYDNVVICDVLEMDYSVSCAAFNITRRGSQIQLGRFLRKVCPRDWPQRTRDGGSNRKWKYVFPSLKELRNKWDALFGGITSWPMEVPQDQEHIPFDV